MVKKTRRKQKGGRLISSGSFGAVFEPPPCAAGTFEAGEVGKLQSKADADKEREANTYIQSKIKDDYIFIHYKGDCDPDAANPDLVALPALVPRLPNMTVMRYDYAGASIDKIIDYIARGIDDVASFTEIKFNNRYKKLVRMLHPLFYGLVKLLSIGVVHRDIKEANICMTPEGAIRLIDFGLAKHVDILYAGGTVTKENVYYPYWPMEYLVTGTAEGIFWLCDQKRAEAMKYIFNEVRMVPAPAAAGGAAGGGGLVESLIPHRNFYVHTVMMALDAAAYNSIFNIMVSSLKVYINQIFTTKAELHPYFSTTKREANVDLAVVDINGNRVFDFNLFYAFKTGAYPVALTPPTVDMINVKIGELERKLREYFMPYFDVFSLGFTLYRIFFQIEGRKTFEFTKKNAELHDNLMKLFESMKTMDLTKRISSEESLKIYEKLLEAM